MNRGLPSSWAAADNLKQNISAAAHACMPLRSCNHVERHHVCEAVELNRRATNACNDKHRLVAEAESCLAKQNNALHKI